MELPLYNQNAESIGTVELADDVFGLAANNDLLHQVITSQMSNQRQVLAHTKGRGEVRGGGKKPWQQKGTGRARHGSIRSPIWRGGGITGGPTKERNFTKVLNKKMVQRALKVALSAKVRDHQLVIVDMIEAKNNKTKEVAMVVNKFKPVLGKLGTILLIMPENSLSLHKAARNLAHVETVEARNLNPLTVLSSTYLMIPKASLAMIEKMWAKK